MSGEPPKHSSGILAAGGSATRCGTRHLGVRPIVRSCERWASPGDSPGDPAWTDLYRRCASDGFGSELEPTSLFPPPRPLLPVRREFGHARRVCRTPHACHPQFWTYEAGRLGGSAATRKQNTARAVRVDRHRIVSRRSRPGACSCRTRSGPRVLQVSAGHPARPGMPPLTLVPPAGAGTCHAPMMMPTPAMFAAWQRHVSGQAVLA